MKTPSTKNPHGRVPWRSVTRLAAAGSLLIGTLVGSTTFAANILTDAGFENGTTGWTKYGVFDINTSANVYYNGCNCGSNVWIYDGANVGKSYGQFTGGDNYNGVYQDVSAAATSVFTATCRIYNSTQDHISGANAAWVEVHFLDSGNNTLALYQSAIITVDTLPLDAWVDWPVTNQVSPTVGTVSTLVAPAGTVKVRYQIVFHQPNNDGGSVYFDDGVLNEISGPVPPTISHIYPDGTVLLQGLTNALTFNVSSAAAITNVQLVLNGVDVSSAVTLSSGTTSRDAKYAGLETNKVYSGSIVAADANGIQSSVSLNFDTFSPANFQFEAEDYDFTDQTTGQAGSYFTHPDLPSTKAGGPVANNYYAQAGTMGTDYLDSDGAGTHAYRASDFMATEVTTDLPRQRWLDAQKTDPTIMDYDVGWFNGGEWLNFTRNYPAGLYNVWSRMSSPGTATQTLGLVTNGWGTPDQQVQTLGTFTLTGGLGWGTYSWVPLLDASGNMVKLNIAGTNTLRLTTGGNNNAQFYMLVPANTNVPVISAVYPDGTTLLQGTNTFSFNVDSGSGINPSGITVTFGVTNPVTHVSTTITSTNGLTVGGTSTSRTVSYSGLALNSLYSAIINVTDAANNKASKTVRFDTFKPSFSFEAEDWDYNSGQYLPNPIGVGAYAGLAGTEGVDFHDSNNGGGTPYRPGTMSADVAGDTARVAYQVAGATDYALGYFSLIGGSTVNEWVNYTRDFPAGSYNVYGRFAAGGSTSVIDVSKVTNGWTTSSQQLQSVGSFTIANTGGWGTYAYAPMTDTYGNLATLNLTGTSTLRLTRTSGGDANVNFLFLVPARTDVPVINQVTPVGFLQSSGTLTFGTSDSAGIAANNIHVTLNGVDVSSKLTLSGTPTAWSASLPGLLTPNSTYTAIISVVDNNGVSASTTVTFDTFSKTSFTWEAEDYDYNGGHFIDGAQTNGYAGLAGTPEIDYHSVGTGGTDPYRSGLIDGTAPGTEPTTDDPRAQYAGGLTPYDVGFTSGGEWQNYTRRYPAGVWNVYARLARGAAGTTTMTLSKVTSGWGTTNQVASTLGSFSLAYTGGWQNFSWVPLTDAQGKLAAVTLNGSTNTLRFTGGGANLDFFMLAPSLSVQAVVSGGQVALTFGTQSGFNYTVQAKNSLSDATWTTVTTVAGDGTVKTVTDPANKASRLYRLQLH